MSVRLEESLQNKRRKK